MRDRSGGGGGCGGIGRGAGIGRDGGNGGGMNGRIGCRTDEYSMNGCDGRGTVEYS